MKRVITKGLAVLWALMICGTTFVEASDTIYKVREDDSVVITNIPRSGAEKVFTYDKQEEGKGNKEDSGFRQDIIDEVHAVGDGILMHNQKNPQDYIAERYVPKQNMVITIEGKRGTREYRIIGRHKKLKGSYILYPNGQVEDTLK